MDVIKRSVLALDSISIYRRIIQDTVMKKLYLLLKYVDKNDIDIEQVINLYSDFFFEFSQKETSLREYIIDRIIFDENPFTLNGRNLNAAQVDLNNLQLVSQVNSAYIKSKIIEQFCEVEYRLLVEELPEWEVQNNISFQSKTCPDYIGLIKAKLNENKNWSNSMEDLLDFHKKYGCGIFARYRAFVWERTNGIGNLKGISSPDPVLFSDLVGYELERSKAIENIQQFINGYPANNVLLYGDRGTGKSSTVKAILNEYYLEGLRLIEVPKTYLSDFPDIIRKVKDSNQKFIIFIDDLVFGNDEENYSALKATLEGGIECKSPNILIYATSNRKHLVKEFFSERKGILSSNIDEEVNARDTIQEKLSLADRFGIHVVFSSPNQERYLEIVEGMSINRNLKIDNEILKKEALKWALWYNGFSARTARQFIDWMEGELSRGFIPT